MKILCPFENPYISFIISTEIYIYIYIKRIPTHIKVLQMLPSFKLYYLTCWNSNLRVSLRVPLSMDSYLIFLFCMLPLFMMFHGRRQGKVLANFTCFLVLHGVICCYYLVMDNKGRQ